MIRFNYENIYLLARGDSGLVVKYITAISNGQYKSLTGASYLVNPRELLRKGTDQEIAEYVGLASFRDYSHYRITGDTRLPKTLIPPWVPDEIVISNKLIDVTDSHYITFLYE